MLIALLFALKSYSFPGSVDPPLQDTRPNGQVCLLVFMCLMFGVEIGYKISARNLIYLLYPCHIMTVVQVTTRMFAFDCPSVHVCTDLNAESTTCIMYMANHLSIQVVLLIAYCCTL